MSNISIFEKRWLDLVFEGKNKAYGAYQLRLENPRTTLLALFYGLFLIAGAAGLVTLFSSFKETPPNVVEIPDDPLVVVRIIEPIVEPPHKVIAPPAKKVDNPELDDSNKKTLDNPTVTEARNADEVLTNSEAKNRLPENNGDENGTAAPIAGTGAEKGSGTDEGSEAGEGPILNSALDRQPRFPGGMEAFYRAVGRNFEKPEMNSSKPVRIIVSFVVEKDGTLTEIRVLNNPGAGFEYEAVRSLKRIRDKWEPGIKNGKFMRTLFTLPIVVKPE